MRNVDFDAKRADIVRCGIACESETKVDQDDSITSASVIQTRCLLLIADELHAIGEALKESNEQNRGVGVFRECLLAVLKAMR